ncbi:MAG: hypothetical protein F6K50_47825 [Moorea sp. SIO3I7]|uniref:hypothetical protein n=1 Tax=Moorena bouillonii TaxID=207920 RepID=UPI000A9DEDB5|nr:hypothetical protein [Moorena bouillonii]NEO02769.1 hypothetical protein [Moorena sp. SIO3I7]
MRSHPSTALLDDSRNLYSVSHSYYVNIIFSHSRLPTPDSRLPTPCSLLPTPYSLFSLLYKFHMMAD